MTVPATPPPELIYRRRLRLIHSIRNSWHHRELLRSLTERQLRSRYKQATLGFVWALAAPVSLLLVFVVFADRVADIDTGGVPYSLFAFTGLLAWTFFSSAVNGASQSLLSNTSLLNKTACPRELFPLSTVIVAGVDTALTSIVLVVLFVATQTVPEPTTVYVPLLVFVQIVLTVGVSFLISIVVVFVARHPPRAPALPPGRAARHAGRLRLRRGARRPALGVLDRESARPDHRRVPPRPCSRTRPPSGSTWVSRP